MVIFFIFFNWINFILKNSYYRNIYSNLEQNMIVEKEEKEKEKEKEKKLNKKEKLKSKKIKGLFLLIRIKYLLNFTDSKN